MTTRVLETSPPMYSGVTNNSLYLLIYFDLFDDLIAHFIWVYTLNQNLCLMPAYSLVRTCMLDSKEVVKGFWYPELYSDWYPVLLFESLLSSTFWNVLSYSVVQAYSVSYFEKFTVLFCYFTLLCYLEIQSTCKMLFVWHRFFFKSSSGQTSQQTHKHTHAPGENMIALLSRVIGW